MTTPLDALERLNRMTGTGEFEMFCERRGIELMTAFGSATDPKRLRPPQDLELAVRLRPEGNPSNW